jgi:glyoxalase family protein
LELTGLHHITAVTGRAAENVAFYTGVLGLRLVKKTVNQDDVSAYHLFYADALGSAGTDITFFDWAGLPKRVPGTGEISASALRVPGAAALDWWEARLVGSGVGRVERVTRSGRAGLAFEDREGQRVELVDDTAGAGNGRGVPGGQPWPRSPVPADAFVTGLYGVTLTVGELEPTAWLLQEVLGFRRGPDDEGTAVFQTGPGGPGTEVRVRAQPGTPTAVLGAGGVHHVAFRVPDDVAQEAWRARIAAARVAVTPVVDRFYFKSIYFREPGGVLYEIATDGPGFATDEPAEHLGEKLALPPFLEPRRAQIEAGLRPLPTG